MFRYSPVGAEESYRQILRVEFHAVLFQEREKLLLEGGYAACSSAPSGLDEGASSSQRLTPWAMVLRPAGLDAAARDLK
jgi:hypothetical protein